MATEDAKIKNFNFWYYILRSFVLGLRVWRGTPFDGVSPNCNSEYINRLMIEYGYAFAFKHNNQLYIAPASKIKLNYMFLPKKMMCADARIVGGKPIYRTVGQDCVYIPLAPTVQNSPFAPVISKYAKRLTQLSDGMAMNEIFSRTEIAFKVKDDASAQKVRTMIDDISNGKIGTLIDDVLADEMLGGDGNGVSPLISNVQYRGYEYETMIRETLREFFEICGISHNAANIMKKEHSVTSEVNSEEEATAIFARSYNYETEKAVERINNMFNTDITVEWGVKTNVQRGTSEQENI